MARKIILAVDQSTAGTKAVAFDENIEIAGKASRPHEQLYPAAGMVEHNPQTLFENVVHTLNEARENAGAEWPDVNAIAITNQRETVIAWDKTTLEPLYNAVVWQDSRAADLCDGLKDEFDYLRTLTGLEPSPFFSAPKLSWLIQNIPAVATAAGNGTLAFGTVESFLLAKLTGGVHKTDMTNACRTMLMDIRTCKWDSRAFALFGIPMAAAPEIILSDDIGACTRNVPGIPDGIPIAAMVGDSHAALYGECCFNAGEAKVTYGTGSSVMMNTGEAPVTSRNGLVTSLGYATKKRIAYCLEGNINTTGASIKWLAEKAELLDSPKNAGKVSAAAKSGVYFVPALKGLAAPHWKSEAKAAFLGITAETGRAELVRAVEESIAFSIADVIKAMTSDTGKVLSSIAADGGATGDSFLMQFQADILGTTIRANRIEEVSALGAALIAGESTGFYSDSQIVSIKSGKTYTPEIDTQKAGVLYAGWVDAINTIIK